MHNRSLQMLWSLTVLMTLCAGSAFAQSAAAVEGAKAGRMVFGPSIEASPL
jgi:hypothetical protein